MRGKEEYDIVDDIAERLAADGPVVMTPGGTWAIAFSYADCIRAPVWPEGKAALSLSFPAGKNVGGALRLPKRMPYL